METSKEVQEVAGRYSSKIRDTAIELERLINDYLRELKLADFHEKVRPSSALNLIGAEDLDHLRLKNIIDSNWTHPSNRPPIMENFVGVTQVRSGRFGILCLDTNQVLTCSKDRGLMERILKNNVLKKDKWPAGCGASWLHESDYSEPWVRIREEQP